MSSNTQQQPNAYLAKAGAVAGKAASAGAAGAKAALDKTPKIKPEHVKLTAEFLGTYMLVFSVGLNKTTGANDPGLKVFGPTSVACTLMIMIYALGNISGGHFNPAVTFTAVVHKRMSMKEGLMYMASQVVAGCAASGTCILMYGASMTSGTHGAIGPVNDHFLVGAPLVEFLYTFLLCFVVLNVAMSKKAEEEKNNYYGVAIGFVVIAGGCGGGYVSGGAFNPAIAIGMNLMTPTAKLFMLPIYVAVQLAGGFFAVTAVRIVRPEERDRTETKDDLIPALGDFVRKIEAMFDAEDTAEFLGTLFLVLTISLNNMLPEDAPSKDAGIWSIGACLMCLIYALGDVSGGLFNPALTVAYLGRYLHTGGGVGKDKICDPQVSPKEGFKYLLVQLIGGGAGAGLNLLVYLMSGKWPAVHVGPKDSFSDGQAFFAEFYGTFLLCYVVICVTTTTNPLKEYTAFCIGGVFVAAGYAFGPLSGGLLNPAVTVSNGVLCKLELISTAGPITYIGAQLLGGLFAAILFRFVTHRDEADATPTISGREITDPLLAVDA